MFLVSLTALCIVNNLLSFLAVFIHILDYLSAHFFRTLNVLYTVHI